MLVHLVEDVIAEKLDNISITSFAPLGIESELGTFIDEAELAQEAEETTVLQFAHQAAF